MKDVVSLLKKPKTFGSQFKKPPLVRSDILYVRKKWSINNKYYYYYSQARSSIPPPLPPKIPLMNL